MKKLITETERLSIIAFYTLANQHYAKVREFERGIARVLGDTTDTNDLFTDAIYADGNDTADDVLKNLCITIKKSKRNTRR